MIPTMFFGKEKRIVGLISFIRSGVFILESLFNSVDWNNEGPVRTMNSITRRGLMPIRIPTNSVC